MSSVVSNSLARWDLGVKPNGLTSPSESSTPTANSFLGTFSAYGVLSSFGLVYSTTLAQHERTFLETTTILRPTSHTTTPLPLNAFLFHNTPAKADDGKDRYTENEPPAKFVVGSDLSFL